jgi:hypothetical protein
MFRMAVPTADERQVNAQGGPQIRSMNDKGAEISSRPFEPSRSLKDRRCPRRPRRGELRPPIMAAKKTPSKSDFILSQLTSLSAADVVKKGKAQGIKFSPQLVYNVRRGSKATKGKATKTATSAAPEKPPKSKSAFIRANPSLSPKEIVEKANAAGLKLDVGYVYNVRGAAKGKRRAGVRAGASLPRPITTMSSTESLLRAVAAEIGLGAAIEILSGERARIRALTGTERGRGGVVAGPDEDDELGPFRIEQDE